MQEINASDVYYKLGEIHSDVKSHETRISNNENKLLDHEERISVLESDVTLEKGIKSRISTYITRSRIIILAIATCTASLVTIAYRLPSPTQEKLITKQVNKIDNLQDDLRGIKNA